MISILILTIMIFFSLNNNFNVYNGIVWLFMLHEVKTYNKFKNCVITIDF